MSSGGGGGDQTTENIPWEGQQGFLRDVYQEAQSLFDSGQLGGLGAVSPYTTQAQDLIARRALAGGSGLVNSATDLAGRTMGGEFLDANNPYLQDAIAYSQQPVIDAFNEQIAPSIDASFGASAGGLGSGAYAASRNTAEDTLARNLAGAATQAGYQNYADERGRMMQTMGMAPGLDQAGYMDYDRLAGVGAQQDARSQAEADQAARAMQQYAGLIYGSPTFTTTTTTGGGGGSDPFSTGAGLLLGGLGAAGSLGWAPFCWVAREVYGADNPRWLDARQWMLTKAPKWLLRLYIRHGERLAEWLKGKDRMRALVRGLFDRVI